MSEHAEFDRQVVSLADVSESVRYGYTASASTDEIGPKFLRITDIVPQCISWHSVPYCEGNERDLEKYLLQVGDIVVARTGATVGYAKQIRTPENAVFASYLVRFRINNEIAEPRFIGHLVESNVYKQYVKSQVGGAAQPNANAKVLGRFSFTLPPRTVQRRIADILCAYDDLIENNRRRIALLEQAARELYREWFVRLRFPGYENTRIVDGLPEGWERKKIADVCRTTGGGTPSTKRAEYWDGDITWVVPTDVTNNDCLVLLDSARRITEEGLRESSAKMVPAETILMTSRASVGFFAMMDREACTNQGFINVAPHDEGIRLYLLFDLINRVPEIRSNAQGTTYPEISKGRFREMDVVIPKRALATEFSCTVSEVIDQVRCLKRSTSALTQARDILLPRLMSGEVAA